MAPRTSTSRNNSGMAVISFDFSAQATWPSDNPNSLAQTLTECRAPNPCARSWLRRAVLPSTARIGRSMPVAPAAAARSAVSQVAKRAGNAVGLSKANTRRKTSSRGTPLGRSRTPRRKGSLIVAHLAIDVGPWAPAKTAISAMTTTLTSGCF